MTSSIVADVETPPRRSRTARSASPNERRLSVARRISTSARKQKSAPPQYRRPHESSASSPRPCPAGSPFGSPQTSHFHTFRLDAVPALARAIGST
jgi:hypothetical protein